MSEKQKELKKPNLEVLKHIYSAYRHGMQTQAYLQSNLPEASAPLTFKSWCEEKLPEDILGEKELTECDIKGHDHRDAGGWYVCSRCGDMV